MPRVHRPPKIIMVSALVILQAHNDQQTMFTSHAPYTNRQHGSLVTEACWRCGAMQATACLPFPQGIKPKSAGAVNKSSLLSVRCGPVRSAGYASCNQLLCCNLRPQTKVDDVDEAWDILFLDRHPILEACAEK